jgi:hypothetical protein
MCRTNAIRADYPLSPGRRRREALGVRVLPTNPGTMTAQGYGRAVVRTTGAATSVGNVISTRQSSGATWTSITGTPIGDWTLTISDTNTIKLFSDGEVDDVLFVVTYAAELPSWV